MENDAVDEMTTISLEEYESQTDNGRMKRDFTGEAEEEYSSEEYSESEEDDLNVSEEYDEDFSTTSDGLLKEFYKVL